MSQLDSEFYETVIAYNMLTDESYLSSIVDHLDVKYFDNKNISKVVSIITEFYNNRSAAPTLTEIKGYLTTDELKTAFKNTVSLFASIQLAKS